MAGRKPRDRTLFMAEADKEVVSLTKGELKAMIAEGAREAAKSAVTEVTTELMAKAAKDGGASLPDFGAMFERMAMAIAEISDQGTSRKRVAPEILAARASAQARCIKLINEARAAGLDPEYKVIAKTYLSERFVEPWQPGPNKQPIQTEIIWKGMPNKAMRPINDVAKAIYAAFDESIGTQEHINGLDNRQHYMTPGGVVVKGDPKVSRREIPAEMLEDVKITNNSDPTAPFVQVLGTTRQGRARQNIAPHADHAA